MVGTFWTKEKASVKSSGSFKWKDVSKGADLFQKFWVVHAHRNYANGKSGNDAGASASQGVDLRTAKELFGVRKWAGTETERDGNRVIDTDEG